LISSEWIYVDFGWRENVLGAIELDIENPKLLQLLLMNGNLGAF